jgi:ABC-2 type transport system permease protein
MAMLRIFDIAFNDLQQMLRDRKTFLFLLIMPILFTLLFGYAFGAFNRGINDPRLPVGFLDQDGTWLSRSLHDQLAASEVIRLQQGLWESEADLERLVSGGKLAAAIIIPAGYSHTVLRDEAARLILIGDMRTTAGRSVESEALTSIIHVQNAVRTALIMEQVAGERTPFDFTFSEALSAWKNPPIRIAETTSSEIPLQDNGVGSLAHTSPGMMLQFAIASLLTSAQVIVSERKSGSLRRLLTTSTSCWQILFGHFAAILVLNFDQFLTLILFAQIFLHVNYLNAPGATLLVAFSAALSVAALGLLIGILVKNEEQATLMALVLMFVLSGIGGAWVPLEATSRAFQAFGHLSPIAWAMDGFKNVTLRGLGIASAWLPALALVSYAVIFFALAAFRFSKAQASL